MQHHVNGWAHRVRSGIRPSLLLKIHSLTACCGEVVFCDELIFYNPTTDVYQTNSSQRPTVIESAQAAYIWYVTTWRNGLVSCKSLARVEILGHGKEWDFNFHLDVLHLSVQ